MESSSTRLVSAQVSPQMVAFAVGIIEKMINDMQADVAQLRNKTFVLAKFQVEHLRRLFAYRLDGALSLEQILREWSDERRVTNGRAALAMGLRKAVELQSILRGLVAACDERLVLAPDVPRRQRMDYAISELDDLVDMINEDIESEEADAERFKAMVADEGLSFSVLEIEDEVEVCRDCRALSAVRKDQLDRWALGNILPADRTKLELARKLIARFDAAVAENEQTLEKLRAFTVEALLASYMAPAKGTQT